MQKNTEKRLTLCSATHIGANIMFLQIGKCCTPFSALHQSFPTLPIILGSSGRKTFFCKIHEAGSLKLDMNVHLPKTRAIPAD
jgi:hypothetical protein